MSKKVVMLVLCRRVITELLIETIEKHSDMKAIGVYGINEARSAAVFNRPSIALVEIHEKHDSPVQEALDLCKEVTGVAPGCKTVILCPEADKASVQACIEAKRHGKIDDFLFYDSSTDYLISKLESLYP